MNKFHEKSPEENKYTSTGIKFWRHKSAMVSYRCGEPETIISTHISPEGRCNLSCPYCSVSRRKINERDAKKIRAKGGYLDGRRRADSLSAI